MTPRNEHILTLERYNSLDKRMLSPRVISYLSTVLGTPLGTAGCANGFDIKHLSYVDNFLYIAFFGCGFSVEQKKKIVSECFKYASINGVYVDSFFKTAVYFVDRVDKALSADCEYVNYYGYGLLSLTQMLDNTFPFVDLFEYVIDWTYGDCLGHFIPSDTYENLHIVRKD
jgi:hypothetical protein